MPTFAELAGVEPGTSEGLSLVSAMKDPGTTSTERSLGWEHEGNRAYRNGRWKIVSEFPGTWTTMYPYTTKGAWELYDVVNDRTELKNLAKEKPAKLKQLIAEYDAWAKRQLVVDWANLEGRKE